MIHFEIPGEPVGKARPRFSRKTGRTYTPDKTVAYEELVRQRFIQEANGFRFGDEAQVAAMIIAFYAIPKSASKKKREDMAIGDIRPTKKPDCDNVAKIVLDSLNGIAYRDDSQVMFLNVTKYYSETPRVAVWLYTWEEVCNGGAVV